MAYGSYILLGQKITVGGVNADPWFYCDTGAYPFRSVCYTYVPDYFDGIKAVQEHNGGVFPATNYTALYYHEDYGSDPVFGIKVTYTGSKFKLSYAFRSWSYPDYIWTGVYTDHYFSDGYAGADPANITENDRARNGIYFGYFADGLTYLPGDPADCWIVTFQHKMPVFGYAFNLSDASFEIATGYPGDRYYPTSGAVYYHTSDGHGNSYQTRGIQLLFDCYSEQIEDYTDDVAGAAGGGGSYQYRSLKVGIPGLPQISIMDTGAATMWAPSLAQVVSLNDYLWTDDFFDNIKKINADPLANIIQFGVVPLDVGTLRDIAKTVKVGNVSTGVLMYPLTSQYIQVDLGSMNPVERWGTSMDYEPNCRASIYLPFCGFVDIPVSELFGKEVNVVYNIDLLSGDFVAFIRVHRGQLDSVLYHRTGNMMLSFPLSAANYSNMYKTIAAGISGVVAGAATGNPGVIASSLGEMAGSVMSGGSAMQLTRTGNFSGAASALSCFECYIMLTQPEQQMPEGYSSFVGYPSFITKTLGDLSGFTKVEDVIDNTVAATDTEKTMIEEALKKGVIL